jgi:transposase
MKANSGQQLVRRPGPKYKLNRAEMEAVRIAHQESEATVAEIALRFGVTKQTIYNVLKRLEAAESENAPAHHSEGRSATSSEAGHTDCTSAATDDTPASTTPRQKKEAS